MKTKLCRPILVESKEPAINSLVLAFDMLTKSFNQYDLKRFIDNGNSKFYDLILISLNPDEKIEVGDKVFNSYNNTVYTLCNSNNEEITANQPALIIEDIIAFPKQYNKVIATQSQLSLEYIQQFIEEYNKGEVKDVEIEMEKLYSYEAADEFDEVGFCGFRPKLTNGFVTIVNKKNKFGHSVGNVTLDDINNLLHSNVNLFIGLDSFKRLQKDIIELFQSYKAPILYTEEEVKLLCVKLLDNFTNPEYLKTVVKDFPNWFNQNKKK